jgi:DNA primase
MNALLTIKQHINKDNIRLLLETHGAKHIQDTGDSFRSTCPLHKGSNPTAFVWNYTNGLWYCFTDCGCGGDIFDFIADVYDLSVEHEFKTVIQKTAEELHIDITNLELGERTSSLLRENRAWMDFISRRQFKDNPVYDISKIGDQCYLTGYRNFTKETIEFFKGRYSYVFNRIVVPLIDKNGEIIGVSMRRIDETEQSKWLHRPKHVNTRTFLYNQCNVTPDKPLFIVEGAFDVWNLHQMGITNVVATLGAHLTEEQKQIIIEKYIDVVLAYDSDSAGKLATKKGIDMLKYCVNLSILDLGDIHDCGDIPDIETFNSLKITKPYEWLRKYSL